MTPIIRGPDHPSLRRVRVQTESEWIAFSEDVRLTFREYQSRRYIPELDGVRAVSIILVLISHYWVAAAELLIGRLGVTFFFVLSGYLITTLLLREETERGRVDLLSFYIRRTCRIFPL